jgi:tetratricopeptide (TPR) repeat protein
MFRALIPALGLMYLSIGDQISKPPVEKGIENASRNVAGQLRDHMSQPLGKGWEQFRLRFVDDIDGEKFATSCGWEEWADGVSTPYVVMTRGYMNELAGSGASLALILSHELARLAVGDVVPNGVARSTIKDDDVDLYAVKLLLRSGYNVTSCMERVAKLQGKKTQSWIERMKLLMLKDDLELWKEMHALKTGLTLLAVEEHLAAVGSFSAITNQFPKSREAQKLRGYAMLLAYFDTISAGRRPLDLSGHVVGLTRTIRSMHVIKYRGARITHDVAIWMKAIWALKDAESLDPNDPEIQAYLGLGYAINPEEDNDRSEQAEKYLASALKQLRKGALRFPAREMELLVNLAVVAMQNRKWPEAQKLLSEAERISATLPPQTSKYSVSAIRFNRACILKEQSKLEEAANLLLSFLKETSRNDPWWAEGFKHYSALCGKLGTKPELIMDAPEAPRANLEVTLANGQVIKQFEDAEAILTRLKKAMRMGGTRRVYEKFGIDLRLYEAVGVIVINASEPSISWPLSRTKAPPARIRVGMPRSEIEMLPGGKDFLLQPFAPFAQECAFYPAWGLATFFDKAGPNGAIAKMIVGCPGARTDPDDD